MKKRVSLMMALLLIVQLVGCGGPRFTLSRSSYDAENGRFVNETTGLNFTVPEGYVCSDDAYLEYYYQDTIGGELASMSHKDFLNLEFVPDFIAATEDSTVELRYINLNEYLTSLKNASAETAAEAVALIYELEGATEISEPEATVIGGLDFVTIRVEKDDCVYYESFRKLSDDFMIMLTMGTREGITFDYFSAFFNGSPRTADESNVPPRSICDETDYYYENSLTGLRFEVPGTWYYYNDEWMAQEYYEVSVDVLRSATAQDWAQLHYIYDYYSYDAAAGDSVQVYFENLTKDGATYGVSEEEYLNKLSEDYQEDGWYQDEELAEVSLSGLPFRYVSLWGFNDENELRNAFIAAYKLNEDYMCVVSCVGDEQRVAEDFWRFFNEQPDAVELIQGLQLSSYNEAAHKFYNPYSDTTIGIPDGWLVRDVDYMAKEYYGDEVTGEELRQWTTEDYAGWAAIYDFEAYDPENGDRMFVCYENMNYDSGGLEKVSYEEFVGSLLEDWQSNESVTVVDSFTIFMDEEEERAFSCYAFDDVYDGVTYHTYLIIWQLNEDYVGMMRADTISDTTIDDFLFLIEPGNQIK